MEMFILLRLRIRSGDILQEVEPFQRGVIAKHKGRKVKLIGLGGNKHRESGLSLPSYERSKSAPPLGESRYVDLEYLSINDELYDKFWLNDRLLGDVRERLYGIALDFINDLGLDVEFFDVVLTGSLANYNWTSLSDIDLHIILDYYDVDDNFKLVAEYFNAKKSEWNLKHDIFLNEHEVEIYVQHKTEVHASTGVYSILDDDWVVKPKKKIYQVDEKQVEKKVRSIVGKMDKISDWFEDGKWDLVKKKTDDLFQKLKRFRRAGLEDGGEMSVENLVFKVLRGMGYLDEMNELRKMSYDLNMGNQEPAKRDEDST